MPRKAYSRKHGVKLGRLPNYAIVNNPDADRHPGAVALSVEMLKFVTHKAAVRVNGKASSDRTINAAKDVLAEMCLRLWRLGFRIQSISAINGKHIEAVVRDHWACGASPKYMASIMTQLKKLDDWLCKPGLVKPIEFYLPEVEASEFRCSMIAAKSKSWSENGIDLSLKIAEADKKDTRFGLMLRMCLALGLRRCEVLQIIPWKDDRGVYFDIRAGIAKGGRARTIPYLSPAQKEVVQHVKNQLKRTEFLGWSDPVLRGDGGLLLRNEKRYSQYMTDIGITKAESGVTGHGLRAEYAEDMSMLMGLLPATRGGTKGQMAQEDEDAVRMQVSLNMGHSRTKVTNAYYGKLTRKIQNSRGERLGGFSLSDGKFASIYMNPPPKPGTDGKYTRLQKRTIEATDILIVLEAATEDGLLSEASSYKVASEELQEHTQIVGLMSKQDLIDLNRIGATLLGKFGVVLGSKLV
jgi:integrase